MRGHGKSTHPTSYNLNDHIKDLTMLMQQLGIKSAHLLDMIWVELLHKLLPKNIKIKCDL